MTERWRRTRQEVIRSEDETAAALRARGWQVDRFDALGDRVRRAAGARLRDLPEWIAVRGRRIAMIECKSCTRNTGRYAVNLSRLLVQVEIAEFFGMALLY